MLSTTSVPMDGQKGDKTNEIIGSFTYTFTSVLVINNILTTPVNNLKPELFKSFLWVGESHWLSFL